MVAALVAGCGGGDSAPTQEEYAEAVVVARDRTDFALARITRAKSPEELLMRTNEAAEVIDRAASDLGDLGAAEGFEDQTEKLVRSLDQLAVDLAAFAHDASQPGGESLLLGGPGLSFDSWDDANAALASLDEQGIKVEQIGRH